MRGDSRLKFVFDERPADSPLVEMVWRTQSIGGGQFISPAASNLELVVTRQRDAQPDGIRITVRGPETRAAPAPIPEDADFLGITFTLGTFLACVPAREIVDGGVHLPGAAGGSFWLHGSAWEFPSFENADTFVARLVREGVLACDPLVAAALGGDFGDVSARTVQRRIRRATGLTHGAITQIERARYAQNLLGAGMPILDVVAQAGYYDQPHLTRSLTYFIGQTPAQIIAGRHSLDAIHNE